MLVMTAAIGAFYRFNDTTISVQSFRDASHTTHKAPALKLDSIVANLAFHVYDIDQVCRGDYCKVLHAIFQEGAKELGTTCDVPAPKDLVYCQKEGATSLHVSY